MKILQTSLILAAAFAKKKEREPNWADKIWIDSDSRSFRDPEGRQTIFHGVNAVYKTAPYIPTIGEHASFDPQNSLNSKDIEDLKSWGMNLVRLGVMWEAVETSRGVYN